MWQIKKFLHKIKNLWRWFPVIWKDKDWDQYYIYEILKFKLKNQAKYIGDRDIHTRAKRDAEIMMLCVRLIDKIQNEYYDMEYLDYQKTKINFVPIENTNYSTIETEYISDNLGDYFSKYPKIYEKVIIENNLSFTEKHNIARRMSRINQERAHKLLFKILEENIEKWWD
jgi:hypothetical protein